jgi:hypothetical protein
MVTYVYFARQVNIFFLNYITLSLALTFGHITDIYININVLFRLEVFPDKNTMLHVQLNIGIEITS